MIGSNRKRRVFAYDAPCDMRKQYDSLAALVTSVMDRDLLSGDLFLFVGRRRRTAKVLCFDGTGLWVLAKRLNNGRFAAPWEGRTELTENELALFLEGSDIVGRMQLSPATVTVDDRRVVFR